MTKLSVNINKIALIRNSRGANYPDLVKVALDCERFGAQGITVHPRPDQRHVRYDDIPLLKNSISTELNIEGYPSAEFMKVVLDNKPAQCTLVPDPPGVLTSDSGWDTIENEAFLAEIISELKRNGIRTSLFLDPELKMVEGAAKVKADRIEFYTGKYARYFEVDPAKSISDHIAAADLAAYLSFGN